MTTPKTAKVLALIAAAQARIAGMQIENMIQLPNGRFAYSKDDFQAEANHLEQLAAEVINQ